jgi:hypothetical protein
VRKHWRRRRIKLKSGSSRGSRGVRVFGERIETGKKVSRLKMESLHDEENVKSDAIPKWTLETWKYADC